MYKKIIFPLIVLITGISLNAQTVDEASIFSLYNQAQGSARSMATGNAFGALGADASSFMSNPAGLGFYRHGEFTFTTQFANAYRKSSLLGNIADDNSIRFQIGNISYVSSRRNVSPNLNFLNWGVSYNKRASFRSNTQITTNNNESSLIDYYRNVANTLEIPEDDLFDLNSVSGEGIPAYMAFQTYLINPIQNIGNAYSSVVSGGRVEQTETASYKGGIDDVLFAFGGNVRDRVYFGATLGIPIYRYTTQSLYVEEDVSNQHQQFNKLALSEYIDISGVGVFLKAGVTVRPNDWLRVGVSVHSPNWVSLTSSQSDSLYTEVDTGTGNYDAFSISVDYDNFSYSLRTAPKVTLSGATFIQKRGFVSLDIDWVGYENMAYKDGLSNEGDNSAYFNTLNNNLSKSLKSTINIRLGGEMVFKKFRVMGGYGFYGSPYVDRNSFSGTNMLSAGLGARLPKFSFDVALQQSFNTNGYRLYNLGNDSPIAKFNNNRTRLSATFGFRF